MRKNIFVAAAFCAALFPTLASAIDVFACEPEWAALVKEIAGKQADVYTATTALQDPHQVQARPSLLAHYRGADLAVCTGAELEIGWFPVLLANGANPRIQPGRPGLFEAFRYVQMLEVPARLDRAEGDIHPFGNPHIQTDPRNIAKVIAPLAQRLAELDPKHGDEYRKRAAEFEQRWNEAIQRWTESAKPLQGISVISHHRSWVYLYAWLGIREVATLEPKPGLPPSAAHLQQLTDVLKREPAKVIVRSAYEDAKPSEYLADRSGLPAVELPFTVGADGTDDLFKLYQVTVDRLLGALKHDGKSG
jgi:zinc/manganese transport system substrate-binding protein